LIASAGLEEQFLPLRPFRLAQVRGGESLLIDPAGLLGAARLPGVRLHEAFRLARLERILRRFRGILDLHRPESAARLDDRSIADFTRLYFGGSVLKAWVAPFAADSSLCDPDSTSRVLFLLRCVARGYAPAGTLRSGLADLAQALVPGDATWLGADVRALEPAGERITAHYAQADGERSIDGDAVVIATPAPVARGIADPCSRPPRPPPEPVSVAAIVVAVALIGPWYAPPDPFRRARDGRSRSSPSSREVRVRLHRGKESPPDRERALQPDPPGGARRDRREGSRRPASATPSRSSSCRALCVRHPRAYPRFDVVAIGDRALPQAERDLRAEGRRLYFAGDYLVDPSLEGAVTSGLRAADQILRDFGIATRAARPGAPGSSRPLSPPASPP
jgi:hypothetical protein